MLRENRPTTWRNKHIIMGGLTAKSSNKPLILMIYVRYSVRRRPADEPESPLSNSLSPDQSPPKLDAHDIARQSIEGCRQIHKVPFYSENHDSKVNCPKELAITALFKSDDRDMTWELFHSQKFKDLPGRRSIWASVGPGGYLHDVYCQVFLGQASKKVVRKAFLPQIPRAELPSKTSQPPTASMVWEDVANGVDAATRPRSGGAGDVAHHGHACLPGRHSIGISPLEQKFPDVWIEDRMTEPACPGVIIKCCSVHITLLHEACKTPYAVFDKLKRGHDCATMQSGTSGSQRIRAFERTERLLLMSYACLTGLSNVTTVRHVLTEAKVHDGSDCSVHSNVLRAGADITSLEDSRFSATAG
ncbi:hypothetical protein CHU98_g498 [Xylaria longipes]|nr:hypothetical protein CHU98_g498 [Xylaria longipes]